MQYSTENPSLFKSSSMICSVQNVCVICSNRKVLSGMMFLECQFLIAVNLKNKRSLIETYRLVYLTHNNTK